MTISKGLIIADPWIGYILDGTKTWEMRSGSASHRGLFGLIRKGTGLICGIARLCDVGAPLSSADMSASFERHRIPEHMIRSGKVAKWNTPWKLADVRRLVTPVPYRHRSGAVTWVELDQDVTDAIALQLGEPPHPPVTPDAPTLLPKANGKLIGQVEITQGNLDNNHIYLRSFFDQFPDDSVGGSSRHEKAAREVTVDWGGGSPVHTDLDGSKRFFRARSWIRNFFELNGAAPGDMVLVEETEPYAYKVRLHKALRT